MYIHYDGNNYPNISIMDQLSIESWLEDHYPNLDCNACVWIVPGTVDPRD
jgi:hypothetical protein